VVSGTIQPARRADLRAEVGSVVTQVLKDNGERVRQGDLLLRLDDTSLRDTLGSAEAAARAAAQALDQAERQTQRLRTLQQQGMTTTQAAEDAELRRNNAQSDLVTARAQVVSARQQLQRTSVRAPFDGVVTERRVSVGDTVQIGRELLKVIDPSSMRFEGLVSADRMSELKTGQSVSFRVNGFPQVLFAGTVTRIDPTANVDTRQVALVVDFADPAAAPKVAGLFAEGRIETGGGEALLLGEGALTRIGSEAFVWRVDGDRLARMAVKLDERDPRSGDFPVTDGLKAGDRILRRPGDALVDGQRVELVAPGALAASAAELK
jgi:RND family efflux transporter MFP subunit